MTRKQRLKVDSDSVGKNEVSRKMAGLDNQAHKRFLKYLLLLTAFTTGGSIMILEVLGFRLFAPWFGYSIYVWGSILGVVMICMSVGYVIGGKLADKVKNPSYLYFLILFSALYVLVIRFFAPHVFLYLSTFHNITGTLIASFFVFGVPMALLSTTSPFVIGVSAKMGHVGTTAGNVYGISTIGSILGTFLCSFYLIPEKGTEFTLTFCFFVLLSISCVGFYNFKNRKTIAAVLLFPLFLLSKPYDPFIDAYSDDHKLLFDGQSLYSRIVVLEDNKTKSLKLKTDFMGIHSIYEKNKIYYHDYWDAFLLLPSLSKSTDDLLLLGLGGGTVVNQYRYFYPETSITAVEIDPLKLTLANRFFNVNPDENTHLIVADARPFLANSEKIFSNIAIDIFNNNGEMPFYLLTKEYFELMSQKLTENGAMMMNVQDAGRGTKLLRLLGNTIASVFPSTLVYKVNDAFNYMIVATKEKYSYDEFSEIIATSTVLPDKHVTGTFEVIQYNPSVPIITDELTGIEMASYESTTELKRIGRARALNK